MIGLATTGSISFGCALVAGRKRVPSPAAGNTALRIAVTDLLYFFFFFARSRRDSWIRLTPALSMTIFGGLALRSRARMRAASRGDSSSSAVIPQDSGFQRIEAVAGFTAPRRHTAKPTTPSNTRAAPPTTGVHFGSRLPSRRFISDSSRTQPAGEGLAGIPSARITRRCTRSRRALAIVIRGKLSLRWDTSANDADGTSGPAAPESAKTTRALAFGSASISSGRGFITASPVREVADAGRVPPGTATA